MQMRLSTVPNILPLTSTLDLADIIVQPYSLYHILILLSAGIRAITTRPYRRLGSSRLVESFEISILQVSKFYELLVNRLYLYMIDKGYK